MSESVKKIAGHFNTSKRTHCTGHSQLQQCSASHFPPTEGRKYCTYRNCITGAGAVVVDIRVRVASVANRLHSRSLLHPPPPLPNNSRSSWDAQKKIRGRCLRAKRYGNQRDNPPSCANQQKPPSRPSKNAAMPFNRPQRCSGRKPPSRRYISLFRFVWLLPVPHHFASVSFKLDSYTTSDTYCAVILPVTIEEFLLMERYHLKRRDLYMQHLEEMCKKFNKPKYPVIDTSLEIRDKKGKVLLKYLAKDNVTGEHMGVPVRNSTIYPGNLLIWENRREK